MYQIGPKIGMLKGKRKMKRTGMDCPLCASDLDITGEEDKPEEGIFLKCSNCDYYLDMICGVRTNKMKRAIIWANKAMAEIFMEGM